MREVATPIGVRLEVLVADAKRAWRRLRSPMVERLDYDDHRDVVIFRVGNWVVEIARAALAAEKHRTAEQMAWQYALDGRIREFWWELIVTTALRKNQMRLVDNIMSHNGLLRSLTGRSD